MRQTQRGIGNPLQCSCLENPRDGGAWWAAVYGVTQSLTRLKLLSTPDTEWVRCHTPARPGSVRRLQVSVPLPGPASAAPRLSSITGRSGPPADEDFENLTERPREDWDPESPLPLQRTRPLTGNS